MLIVEMPFQPGKMAPFIVTCDVDITETARLRTFSAVGKFLSIFDATQNSGQCWVRVKLFSLALSLESRRLETNVVTLYKKFCDYFQTFET